ncbi:MAG: Potassium efflux system KefA protein / Small-conductance mechanosensitive channel, partial [uncultured Truepera sp.]
DRGGGARRVGHPRAGSFQNAAQRAVGRRAGVSSPHQAPARRRRHRHPVSAYDALLGRRPKTARPTGCGGQARRRV